MRTTSPWSSSPPKTQMVRLASSPAIAIRLTEYRLQGSSNLQARLERMSQALRPLFVTVTWGAGGSTAARSLELAEICQRQLGLTTCLHLTCTNMNRTLIDEALEETKALGIRNILALRGDPPRSEEYNIDGEDDSNKDFNYAVDLVKYIRKKYGDYFCIGVTGYPEGHADESHPEVQDPLKDLPYLIEKTQAGADFIMTQLTYDIEAYKKYEALLRNHESGTFKNIPIIPGLMPIQSYHTLTRVTKLSHAKIPPQILAKVEACKADDEAVKRVGVDIVSDLVESIKKIATPGHRGFHFYTLNLEKSVSFILERCNLIPPSSEAPSDSELEFESAVYAASGASNGVATPDGRSTNVNRLRASSMNSQPHNRVIVDRLTRASDRSERSSTVHETSAQTAGYPALNPPNRNTALQISEGLGSLGREATWDDFPNGRWGDARSPAFGEIDGYGPSLHVTAQVARKLWGTPTCRDDISNIFKRLLSGELHAVPWSEGGAGEEGGLNPETAMIKAELLKLVEGRGWWTLASQPAVNGVRNDHPVFGWGPRGEGFVFQKAFVEFFCSGDDFHSKLKPLLQSYGHDEFAWFATNAKGDFQSSTSPETPTQPPTDPTEVPFDADPLTEMDNGSVNAVTWGVFRGKEIVTPTIIEAVSFRAWGEEAFGIWEEWRRVFPRGSPSEKLIREIKDDVWLVCVVGQRFGAGGDVGKESNEEDGKLLWKVLAGEQTK
ncbi:methylenetetrahydrofolate reductase [Trichophyton tonsurans CBS 112818]|uniref:Methylenetetrahydrofolate reductase n=1 Tax=Trichophyton tonsurans (strain CBS 112818) TaxID=647933 RepID=F2RNV8_TRIT1|nr:methylenetetrahydrofolate reductase [Trichophyton tonsurans CBS 112818]